MGLLAGVIAVAMAVGPTSALAVAPPVVSIDAPSGVAYTTAHLSGMVDPQGSETTYQFEVSTEPEFLGWTAVGEPRSAGAGSGAVAVEADLAGLTQNTTYDVRLIARNAEGTQEAVTVAPYPVFVTLPVAAPTVAIAAPEALTSTTAHLSGQVNPNAPGGAPQDPAFDTAWRFQCNPECPGLTPATILADGTSHEVSADATGLQPNTAYEVSLVAENAGGQAGAGPEAFSTGQSAPATVTGPALTPSATGAELTGTVNPYGLQSSYYFEYGTTSSYGTKAPTSLDGVAGNGRTPRTVSRQIAGLEPNTTYHYRLNAKNAAGATLGDDQIFTTEAPAAPNGRGYEMVSPVEKNGIPVSYYIEGSGIFRASPDGDAIRYSHIGAFPGGESAPLIDVSVATRTSGGWSSVSVDKPFSNLVASGAANYFSLVAVSEDLRHAIAVSNQKLTPDAVEGRSNLYRTDTASGATVLLASDAAPVTQAVISDENFVGVSSDARTVVYLDEAGSMTAATEGRGTRRVSVLPDGSTATEVGGGPSVYRLHVNPVSSDGSRVYWCLRRFGACSEWYLRSNAEEPQSALASTPTAMGDLSVGSQTITNVNTGQGTFAAGAEIFGQGIPVGAIITAVGPGSLTLSSASTEAGTAVSITSVGACTEPTKACTVRIPAPGKLVGASFDGRLAEFGDNLPGYERVYLFHADTGTATDIGPGSPSPSAVALPERSELYYGGTRVHGGAATQFAANTHLITSSSNGDYLAFTSTARLTSFDNTGHEELYLYEPQSESLVCVSCRRDGGSATGNQVGHTRIGQWDKSEGSEHWRARSVVDDGTVFFDTPEPLVAADVNGVRDVYSYRAGHVTLISPGVGPESTFVEVTPDGSNVFFVTEARLVGQDQDHLLDLYDARVGGGIAAQNPVASPECAEEGCRGVTAVPPSPPLAGSESLTGIGNMKPVVVAKRVVKKAKPVKCKKGSTRKRGKCVKAKKKAKAKKTAPNKANINRRVR